MELVLALAGLFVLVAAVGRIVGSTGTSSDLLAGLFRTSHDLGWPVGVQEEDLPPHIAAAETPSQEIPDEGRVSARWDGRVSARVRAGTARR
jgi:hypothetical protein